MLPRVSGRAGTVGYRSGHYGRTLITRVGKLELRVPQDRDGRFSTELFERYQRSERALVAALAEMYVQGVSTRKVKAITEELCGHSFSASSISAINKTAGREPGAVRLAPAERGVPVPDPGCALREGARSRRHRRPGGADRIRVDWDGRRQVLGVELANRESRSSWRDFLLGLRERGLTGVEFVVADDHAGLKASIREVLPEAAYQRCYVHFPRNALDYVPRKVGDDCLQDCAGCTIGGASGRRSIPELLAWVEENIEETLSFYRLPRQHHKHLKSTNMLERLNEEIKRRTHVVRIFPNAESCLRLIRALCVETHENWLEAHRYLNMDFLRELKKETLRKAA